MGFWAQSRARSSRASATLIAAAAALALGTSAGAAPPSSFPAAGPLVWENVAARARPNAAAKKVLLLRQFRRDFRRQFVLAVEERQGSDGEDWYRLRLPMRPNGTFGWVPAESVDVQGTTRRVLIGLSVRRLSVYERNRLLFRTRVAIGAPGAETPTGLFYITAKFRPTDPFYGSYALETSAYSRLSEWPGGGVVGIHGTNMPSLLGQAVSHGCIRVSNAAALRLKTLVPEGTPLAIVR